MAFSNSVTFRVIGRSVSDDFISWTQPETVMEADEHDPPGMEFYGMPVFRYEGHYLGLLYAYHARPEEPRQRNYGTIDVQLASSRNGLDWERAGDRRTFLPNGPPGSIDAGEIYMALGPVLMDDELWFYYSPGTMEHGVTGRSGPICLAKLRVDGFVSVDADAETGALITKPFTCWGDSLHINAAAKGGLVAVAVLDEEGVQCEGFGRMDCALFDGDSVDQQVTWRRSAYGDLKGRVIRLKFYLRDAHLYGFVQQ